MSESQNPAAGAAAPIRHGGDLAVARRRFPGAPEPWLDLSTGINPVPLPVGEIAPEAWSRLPGRDALDGLLAAAAIAYDAGPATRIVAAPGTQAIIQRLPDLVAGATVAVLGPTYQEHAAAWRAAGRAVALVDDPDALARADIGVLVNPNNPDGRLLSPATVAGLGAALAARGGTLVVDEAFMDVVRPPASVVPLRSAGTIVLRSFGKAYGLAGLRLGFALADPAVAGRLEAALGPWAVSGPALEIGRRALTDRAWLDAATARLARDAARLDRLLAAAGFAAIGGTALFRLVAHAEAAAIAERLGFAGILVRAFDDPTRLRFGVPAGEAAFARLADALGAAVPAEADCCRTDIPRG